jgi:hypothetical protein
MRTTTTADASTAIREVFLEAGVTDGRRAAFRFLARAGAGIILLSLPVIAAGQPTDTTAVPRNAAGLTAKGYLSARYAYVGSFSAATVYSGMRMTGSLQLSALSDRIILKYRSHHWLSLAHTEKHVLESAFADRNILQTISLETDGLLVRGLRTTLGRFFPDMDYASSPVIDGGALAYELGGFSIGGAAGRMIDIWDGTEESGDILAAGQLRYRTERLRASAGFQSSSYLDVVQREIPAGVTVSLSKSLWLEAYGGYDLKFKETVRAGLGLSWRANGGSLSMAASQWRNPFDQLYLVDKIRTLPYWGLNTRPVPSTYNDLRVSGSWVRGEWGIRGTLGVMGGVRAGWVANSYLTSPLFFGFRASAGAQGMKSDYIEFYSLDATVTKQLRDVSVQLQSQTRNYNWRPRPSGLHNTDTYSEISAEYPLRRHLYLSAAAGGFFRHMGDEGFKPQAELRLIARI